MTHLQKKCLVGSFCLHGLTVAVFLATAAFRSAPTITEEQVLTLIPATVLDRPGVGVEPAPAAVKPQPSPPATVPTPPRPQPQPAQAAPPKPQTPPNPATPPKTVAATRSTPVKPAPTPAPTRPEIKVDLTPAAPSTKPPSRSNPSAAQEQAAAQEAKSKLIQQAAEALAALGSSVQGKASPVSAAPLAGQGGGEAYISYDNAVASVYYNAWQPETTHRMAVAVVKIIVLRNGSVTSSEFVTKSGDALLDHSVQRALDAVKQLPPFPPNATDVERSYIIKFDPETKQSAG